MESLSSENTCNINNQDENIDKKMKKVQNKESKHENIEKSKSINYEIK